MQLLITWVALSFAFFVAAKVLPGMKIKGGIGSHLIVSAIFGGLVFLVGWLLFTVIAIGTLGLGLLLPFLTRLVVMTILLLVTDKLTSRLTVKGLMTAFFASLIVAVVGSIT